MCLRETGERGFGFDGKGLQDGWVCEDGRGSVCQALMRRAWSLPIRGR
jgi:hypothetical protein